ncbi:MAG: NADH-dependent [FeFe] hydrogenase, group A6 [Clostridia bacterium]|nr:NADH-dependent [FeFe] hydrogenase, group A6 [Clostridia bacterium]MDR3643954.1 NADH-dependent [FeFe] hydrogenase, group A6 [Clostridia bacterium]
MINITINGKKLQVEDGLTIMEAASRNNIFIPSLCYLEGVHKFGSCRICVVEVERAKSLLASCITPAQEGMVVYTNTPRVRKARKILYELMLSDHPKDCLSCTRNQSCELQKLGERIGVSSCRFEGETSPSYVDSTASITRDAAKCILCRRCVTACNEIQGVGAINAQNRGFKTVISPAMELPLADVSCVGCGQCTLVCPVGALKETSSIPEVWDVLNDPTKRKVIQVAPAIRAAIGEEFGYEPGTLVTGKLAAALRAVGFDDVFDTNFTADLTIMEEGTELLGRLKDALTGKGATLPMITSCSPGWIKFSEHFFPGCLDNLSTCKSPHTMLGALAKSYYAKKAGVDPKDMYVVSVMPCTAKKFEIDRPEMANDGMQNVDAVLTTRELASLIKQVGVDFRALPDEPFDNPLGLSSGAADIFGVTGGVMEAALRTVYELITGKELPFDKLHVTPIMGLEQVKEAAITFTETLPEYDFLKGVTLRVAVTSGLKGARKLLEQIAEGKSPYHFIEVMCCPGGCIAGGGQPRPTNDEVRLKRLKAIYREDEGKQLRKSHNNPYITEIYEDFLGVPCGHLSHELLHTTYTKRGKYNELKDK